MDESTEVRTDGNSLLKAVYLGRLRLTRLLLEGGAYINESNEHGETPLMVACKTKHWDSLSVPKHKMVRYLLENGADPNIQDKTGKTALMHACQDEAGAQTLPVLLSRGADPTLQDHAGSSSLVYALNSDNADVLAILLDACKAKGKEVIFITTSKLPGGQQTTKQYLNVPPLPDLQESAPGTDSQLRAPPPPQGSATRPGSPLLGLRGPHGPRTTSPVQPPSPLRVPGPDRHPYLHRINSEQWAKGVQPLFPAEDLDKGSPEEEPGLRVGGPAFNRRPPAMSRHHSMDVKDSAGLLRALENASGTHGQRARRGLLGRKMSYDGAAAAAAAAASLHSASHPNLHQDDGAPFARRSPPADHDPDDCLGQLSSLQNVVRWRNLGMDHYSSDSQLPQFGASKAGCGAGAAAGGGHKAAAAAAGGRGATASGSRDSPEGFGRRQGASWMERRGSGALLLDHIAHTRPGCLPPLNPHTPIPHIGISPSLSFPLGGSSKTLNGVPSGSKPPQPPCFPKEPKDKRVLWRRHSMQSEQLAQLVDFQDVCRR